MQSRTSTNLNRPSIAICGAGIAGLTLAVRLSSLGFQPAIYEQRSELACTTEGAFLTIAPNGSNALRAIACLDAVRQAGTDTGGIEILNASGKRVALAKQQDFERTLGAPSITIERGRLIQILIGLASSQGINVRFQCELLRSEISDGNVKIFPASAPPCTVDMLVAADGLRSRLRKSIFPEYPEPRFTGLIGTGGVSNALIPSTGGIMRMTFGNKAFFGYITSNTRRVYWFNSYTANGDELDKIENPRTYAHRIRDLHREDPFPNWEILREVPAISHNYPIYDLPELPKWSRKGAILLGDAAHAVGPHAGQGASMAIEDALVLAACLDAEPGIEEAFDRFEGLRRSRIRKVIRLTAHNSSQKRSSGKLGLLIRDLILPLVVPLSLRSAKQLSKFRADLTPLRMP